MSVRLVLALALLLDMTGCIFFNKPKFTPPPLTAPPAPSDSFSNYQSTVTASSTGSVSVGGSVKSGQNPYNDSRSSGPDGSVQVNDSRVGDEHAQSCGSQGTDSASTASAHFDTQNDAVHRTYGFALNADAQARGGFWRGKVLFACSGSNDTNGVADASATGRINLTYSGGIAAPDKLVVRVQKNHDPVSFSVTDSSGKPVPQQNLSGSLISDLPTPGPYTVTASIGTHAGGGGGCPACGQTTHNDVTVSVQSMRDALALGYGGSLNESFQVPLPVFVKTADILAELQAKLFTDDGRYFPCRYPNPCADDADDIYIEWPELSAVGGWIVFKAHVAGHVPGFWFIRPGITGEIIAYGAPKVEGDALSFDSLALETQSSDWLFNLGADKLRDKLTTDLKEKAKYDLTPQLQKIEAQLKPHFPVQWGSACLTLGLDSLHVSSVIPKETDAGIQVNFRAGINIVGPDQCKQN